MIPKTIYYCWFGGESNQSDTVKSCIDSWHRVLDDYKIVKIDENNLDMNDPYIKSRYESRQFAFLSDYIRLTTLKNNPGIYLDTDVFIVRKFTDEILSHKFFVGYENTVYPATVVIGVSEKNHKIINEFLDKYINNDVYNDRGQQENNPVILKSIIDKYYNGRIRDRSVVVDDDIALYPRSYFCGLSYNYNLSLNLDNTTIGIHEWEASASDKSFRKQVSKSYELNKEGLSNFLKSVNCYEEFYRNGR
jgi:hypothetical protein